MVLLRLLKWLLALFDVFSSKLLLSSQRHNNNSRQPAAQPTEISTLEYIHFTIIIYMILAYHMVHMNPSNRDLRTIEGPSAATPKFPAATAD